MPDYSNILVAIDFSEAAHTVIKRAIDIAKQNNTTLTLIHTVEYMPPIDVAYEPVLSASWVINEEDLVEQARNSLKIFCDQNGINNAKQIIVTGSPKNEITLYASDNNVDLVIIGSHGRHGIELLLGSTANGVLHRMNCDVLAVKISD